MIYLIDDNKNNMRASQFGVFFVEQGTYSAILNAMSKLTKGADLSFLKDAACILIHKTMEDCDEDGNYLNDSHDNVQEIIETVADYGSKIPLVIFSNKMRTTEYDAIENPDCIFQLNKTLFYSRMQSFVELYQREKKIEFRLLTEGQDYQTAAPDRLANQLLDSLIKLPGDKSFQKELIDQQLFESFYPYTGLPGTCSHFIQEMEATGTTVKTFKDNISLINESISLYGTNIHNWKK